MSQKSRLSPSGSKQSITKTVIIASTAGVLASGSVAYYVVPGFADIKPGSIFTYSLTGRIAAGLVPLNVILGQSQFNPAISNYLVISATNVGAPVLMTSFEITGRLELPKPVQLEP